MKALGNFFEQVLAPYLEQHVEVRLDKLEGRMDALEGKVDNLQTQVNSMNRKLDLVAEKVTDHERKIATLSP